MFLAKEVANWIEYSESNISKMLANVDDDEKNTCTIITSGSNYQTQAWCLMEDGVYEVLMQSRKPIAKQLKKEVKAILKSIRKYGYYSIKEKEKEEKLELQKMRAKAMELNAKTRAFNSIMKTMNQYKNLSPIAIEVFDLKALESAFGTDIGKYLPETEKTYSAKEVGKMLGITTNSYDLKMAEYGVFKLDKSRYSNKEVENFYYNQQEAERI